MPAKYKSHAHHWLILHGRYTCLARKPLCETCLIGDLCKWPGKTVITIKSLFGRLRHGRFSRRKTQGAGRFDAKAFAAAAGLPPKAASWVKSDLRVTGNFKRDAAAAGKFWQEGAGLLAKLPRKPQRNPATKSRCRNHHRHRAAPRASSSWPATPTRSTASSPKISPNFVRVEELCYDAAKLVPGLTPTRKQVEAERAVHAEREGRRRGRSGHFPRQRARRRNQRHASVPRHAAPEEGSARTHGRIHEVRRHRFRPGQGRAPGQDRDRHHPEPALPQRRGRRHAGRHRNRRRHRHSRFRQRDLRAARRHGRASEIQGPQRLLQRHQSDPHLHGEDSLPLVHHPRHGHRQQDAARARHLRHA